MLSNAYFIAKFRFDTAENEPAKNLQNLNFCKKMLILQAAPISQTRRTEGSPGARSGAAGARLLPSSSATERSCQAVSSFSQTCGSPEPTYSTDPVTESFQLKFLKNHLESVCGISAHVAKLLSTSEVFQSQHHSPQS